MEGKFVYEVQEVTSRIEINADWLKEAWKDIPAININNFMGSAPYFFPKVQVRLKYDKDNLYLIFNVNDRYVRCLTNEINGPVWEDSCVEFFFAPDPAFPARYFNLEVNCGGTPLMHYNIIPREHVIELDSGDIGKIEIAHSLPQVIDPEIKHHVEWSLEYRIPISILRKYSQLTPPAPGIIWKGNFYKIAENNSNPHYLTWSPVINPVPDFHLPGFFGKIKFV